ncbi:hypothetical protein ACQEVB_14690 [Pseudonocardia sp. CA-107938]|uniref:hypothetical protein n=1 Tax=Pseudonocardia sp. CA-107938 TaxID=3240021 RepID=UPI003D93E128
MSHDLTFALVDILARNPGATDRLLAEHVDDGSGRCQVCSAGPQAGRMMWPCRLYGVAEVAARVVAGSGS